MKMIQLAIAMVLATVAIHSQSLSPPGTSPALVKNIDTVTPNIGARDTGPSMSFALELSAPLASIQFHQQKPSANGSSIGGPSKESAVCSMWRSVNAGGQGSPRGIEYSESPPGSSVPTYVAINREPAHHIIV